MFKLIVAKGRIEEALFMAMLSFGCFGISVVRVLYSKSFLFLFLNWNLFLAFIPWLLTNIVITNPTLKTKKITYGVLLLVWLLFFPNAPYILTDLFHLRIETAVPIWFDLVMILCFAWTGLLFGFLSLWDIENLFAGKVHSNWVRLISIILLFLGSFGIYLGRYLRWNSWDILSKPFELVYDISDRFIHPFIHPKTWGVTFAMFTFLNLVYWSFRLVIKRNTKTVIQSE